MEGVMRHFYFRALVERSIGDEANWDKVDALMVKTLAAAEKFALQACATVLDPSRW
jgi:hypothetical protein